MRIVVSQEHIVDLIRKYANREEMTAEEVQDLEVWRSRSEGNRRLPDQFRDPEWVKQQLRERATVPSEEIWEKICRR
jgi:hypothetical protein